MVRIRTEALIAVCICLVGALLLIDGVRITAASLFAGPARLVKSEISNESQLAAIDIERAIHGLHLAEQWWPSAQTLSDRAFLELARLERQRLTGFEAAEALARARRDLDETLAREPLNPYSWARLAYVYTVSPGPSPASAIALERSFQTGPLDRQLTLTRYELSLANWHVLPARVRTEVERELQLTWEGYVYRGYSRSPHRRRMIASALAYNRTQWLRDLVVDDEQDAFHFDAMLRQERSRDSVDVKIDADSEPVPEGNTGP